MKALSLFVVVGGGGGGELPWNWQAKYILVHANKPQCVNFILVNTWSTTTPIFIKVE